MIKNWGVIGGVAAAVAAGVYVLWGPITDRRKRKRGKSQRERVIHRLYAENRLKIRNLQQPVFSLRYGSWFVELRQHLLPELFASGFGSMSVFHPVAGDGNGIASNPVLQRQSAVHDTAPATQWYITPAYGLTSVLFIQCGQRIQPFSCLCHILFLVR